MTSDRQPATGEHRESALEVPSQRAARSGPAVVTRLRWAYPEGPLALCCPL